MDYVYKIVAASVKEKTDESRRTEYEIAKLKFPAFISKGFDGYENFLRDWGEYNYSVCTGPEGFFLTECEALYAAENNIDDINECGYYPYVVVMPVAVGTVYPESMLSRKDMVLFKYNKEAERYSRVKRSSYTPAEKCVIKVVSDVWMGEDAE